jgi:hypothetical protein
MGLFSKKSGGTKAGNFFRSFSNQLTHGVLGNGDNRINADGLTGAELAKKLSEANGTTYNDPTKEKISNSVKDALTGALGENKQVVQGVKSAIWSKYKIHIIASATFLTVLIAFLIYKASHKKKGGFR